MSRRNLPVRPGDSATSAKTVSESDVYLFAGITGDLSPNHVNEEAMRATRYGRRVAHGALLVGYMSSCSTAFCARLDTPGEFAVSAGYDRIRFIAPVFLGDTITIEYRVREVDQVRRRTIADVTVTARGESCAVASHILQWVAT
ncbi:MAG: dehydratase [Chloroflexi bacterium RBG_16_72_14]|nr:MAG: dehydratase [Chloroflexi bacterium RBG_16_72_14]